MTELDRITVGPEGYIRRRRFPAPVISISITALLAALLVAPLLAAAQTPPPVATSPLPTPTSLPVLAVVTLTPAVTPTPELPYPPGGLGEWLKFAATLIKRLGLWGLPLLLLVFVLYLVSKAFREWSDAAVKRWATRAQDGWYTFRLRRRTPPEIRDYLDGLIKGFKNLELASIARRDVDRFGYVSLESVYVPLLTPAGGSAERAGFLGRRIAGDAGGGEPDLLVAGEGEERGRPLTQLLPEHPRLVLVGEAGSGKTTFLKFVALTLARAGREKGPRWARQHLGWAPRPLPVPVFLPLGGFGSWLSDQEEENVDVARSRLLLDYLKHHLGNPAWIEPALKEGHCLVLLDGLDEVPGRADRTFVVEAVNDFAQEYEGCRFIVTCRPEGYEGMPLGLFHRETVGRFGPQEIMIFVVRWCAAMEPEQPRRANELAEDLLRRIADTPAVGELADNPLRLTVIAIVHYSGGHLPERRAKLYERCVEVLLTWDEARVGRGARDIPEHYRAALTLSSDARRQKLEEIAFRLQSAEPEGALEAAREEMVEWILEGFRAGAEPEQERQARADADAFLTWVVERSYLMRELDARLAFRPRAFQEYLAARRLARRKDYLECVRFALPRDWWEETLLLTAGHMSASDAARARELLEFILAQPDPDGRPHHHLALAARALVDTEKGAIFPDFQTDVARRVADLLERPNPLPPRERLLAGDALGTLGDPRDLDVWRVVEGGPFLMGSTDEEVAHWKEVVLGKIERGEYAVEGWTPERLTELYGLWLDAERGAHQVDVPPFAIAAYPVTHAQFARFVEAKGYDTERFWTAAGWLWRQGEIEGWGRSPEQRSRPMYWHDPRYNGANRPVVGVTWYEAAAYCNWLTEHLRQTGALGADERVCLPSEAQWEKAARGAPSPLRGEGRGEGQGVRVWPWGDEWDALKANTAEGDLGTTTPVGMYPEGTSPYGALDMIGNVWEWCSSRWGWDWEKPEFGYPYRADDGREEVEDDPERPALRIVRGGSWYNDATLARCAARTGGHPDGWSDIRGFRCARVSE